jgi:metallo-beta-lactamase class B
MKTIATITAIFSGGVVMLAAALTLSADQSTPGHDNDPVDPFRIAENVYYVGAHDIASYLITSSEGHIIIDAGYEETVPLIAAHVATLGFRLRDVRVLLNTQAHFDHAAGFARLKELTGAKLMVSAPDADIIEKGGRGDFYFGDRAPFPAASVDRRLKDGDEVRVGDAVLTARLTPGHTKGTTTWTFDARDYRDRRRVYHVVVLGGLTILEGTRLTGMPGYPQIARDYERTFEMLKELPCDIFLGAHASYYDGMAKFERLRAEPDTNPFVDSQGFRTFVARAERRFGEQLARESRK